MGWGQCCGRMWGLGGGSILGVVGSLVGLFFILGLLALVVLAAIWLLRRTPVSSSISSDGSTGGGDPLDVARRRLAAGDLTVGEFERIREELRDD